MASVMIDNDWKQTQSKLLMLPNELLCMILKIVAHLNKPIPLNTNTGRSIAMETDPDIQVQQHGEYHEEDVSSIYELAQVARERTTCRFFWYATRDTYLAYEFVLDVMADVKPGLLTQWDIDIYNEEADELVHASEPTNERYLTDTPDIHRMELVDGRTLKLMHYVIKHLTVRIRLDGTYSLTRYLHTYPPEHAGLTQRRRLTCGPSEENILWQFTLARETLLQVENSYADLRDRDDQQYKHLKFDIQIYTASGDHADVDITGIDHCPPEEGYDIAWQTITRLPPVDDDEAREQYDRIRATIENIVLFAAVPFQDTVCACDGFTIDVRAGNEPYYGYSSRPRWSPDSFLRTEFVSDITNIVKKGGKLALSEISRKWILKRSQGLG